MKHARRAALLGCLLLAGGARAATSAVAAPPAAASSTAPVPAPPIPAPALAGAALPNIPGHTLDQVRAAGRLSCGVVAEPEDWTKSDLHGNVANFDIEICKAISVAALGGGAKLAVHLYASALEAGAGLKRGEVQVVVGITPNLTAIWRDGITFGPPVLYDGLSVLVRGDSAIRSVADLAGARICYVQGTDNEDVLLAHTVGVGIKMLPFPFQEEGEMEDGLGVRHCDGIAAFVTHLALERAANPRQLGHDRILDDWLQIAPLAPATRQGDPRWDALVAWTVNALIQAEQSGVTRANVGIFLDRRGAEDPQVQRLLGPDWASARALGLADHRWAATVIATVGNYGEIYDRTVGRPDRLPRGRNALWNAGGLLVPEPVQ